MVPIDHPSVIQQRTLSILLLLVGTACAEATYDEAWLNSLYEEGRQAFYQTIREHVSSHPRRTQLTEAETTKIQQADIRYERLYELLVNVYYQKDEPLLRGLLDAHDAGSMRRFGRTYLELARFAGEHFVESFFAIDEATDSLKQIIPHYRELDAVDLVIRSIGYDAKLDVPEREMFANPVSAEFDRQGALDAARFREAHEITKGEGIKIAILDTGIDESHSIFRSTHWGRHFSLVGRTGKPWEADAPVIDWGAHGTLISSVATRYAPEAQLTMYKFGDGELQNDPPYQLLLQAMVAAAVYRAVHDGNDIISLSAAGSTLDSDYLREAVRYAYEQNRVLISGNAYQRWAELGFTRNFPSQYETVVSVTAADRRADGTYGYWEICSRDSATTVAAPNDIFAAFPTYMESEDTYIPSISAAIPTVASVFALAASVYPRLGTEAPGEYAQALMDLVTENANPQKVGFDGFSVEAGYGMIDAAATVQAAMRRAAAR